MRTNFKALPLVLVAFSSVFPAYALLVLSANSKHQIYGVKISTNYGNVLLGKGWGSGTLGSPGTKRLYSWVSFDNDVFLLTSDLDVFVNNQYFGKVEKGADLRVDAGGVSINQRRVDSLPWSDAPDFIRSLGTDSFSLGKTVVEVYPWGSVSSSSAFFSEKVVCGMANFRIKGNDVHLWGKHLGRLDEIERLVVAGDSVEVIHAEHNNRGTPENSSPP